MKTFVKAAALSMGLLCSLTAGAQDVISYAFDGRFDDGTFALENAIINRGLVIDFTSHVGEMLNRAGADIG